MELLGVSAENILVVASFVVPGYFAVQAYGKVIPKVDKAFSRILTESLAYSVIITGTYNGVINHISHNQPIYITSIKYFFPLLIISSVLGYGVGRLSDSKQFKQLASQLELPSSNDDFIDAQFRKLGKREQITVTLKNGEVFRGVRAKISTYRKNEVQLCYFNYFSWYNKLDNTWDSRAGSLIFSLGDIQYIETPKRIPDN